MATIWKADGSLEREVKNLGWLLRHWQDVERFIVTKYEGTAPVTDARFVAKLRDGRSYMTDFGSALILWRFLHRRTFFTLPVKWFNRDMVIRHGDDLSKLPLVVE